jgi:hypothetical protein
MTNQIKLVLLGIATLFIVSGYLAYQYFIVSDWTGFVIALCAAIVFYFAFINTLCEVGE